MRGWLLTVARNLITDRYRAKSARPVEVPESPTTPPVQEDHAQQVVDSMVAMEALDRLFPDRRDVLLEIYFRGQRFAEAAKKLGIPPGTVKSRSHYALKTLRELYANKNANTQKPVALREVAA